MSRERLSAAQGVASKLVGLYAVAKGHMTFDCFLTSAGRWAVRDRVSMEWFADEKEVFTLIDHRASHFLLGTLQGAVDYHNELASTRPYYPTARLEVVMHDENRRPLHIHITLSPQP